MKKKKNTNKYKSNEIKRLYNFKISQEKLDKIDKWIKTNPYIMNRSQFYVIALKELIEDDVLFHPTDRSLAKERQYNFNKNKCLEKVVNNFMYKSKYHTITELFHAAIDYRLSNKKKDFKKLYNDLKTNLDK
jgi:hypothetical protein